MKTERIIGIIFLLAVVFRFLNYFPGCLLLTIMSCGLLMLIYFPFGFYFFSDRSIKRQSLSLSIIGGFALFIAVGGILFKMMRWPGYYVLMSIGSIGLTVLFIIVYSFSGKNVELNIYYRNYKIRIIFWLILMVVFCCLTHEQIIKIENRNNPLLLNAILRVKEAEEKGDTLNLNNLYHERDSLSYAADGYTNYVREY